MKFTFFVSDIADWVTVDNVTALRLLMKYVYKNRQFTEKFRPMACRVIAWNQATDTYIGVIGYVWDEIAFQQFVQAGYKEVIA